MESISKFLAILRIRGFIVNWMKSYSTWDFIQFETFLGSLPLDNTKVLCYFDFAIGLSVVASRYRLYPISSFKRKLISNQPLRASLNR